MRSLTVIRYAIAVGFVSAIMFATGIRTVTTLNSVTAEICNRCEICNYCQIRSVTAVRYLTAVAFATAVQFVSTVRSAAAVRSVKVVKVEQVTGGRGGELQVVGYGGRGGDRVKLLCELLDPESSVTTARPCHLLNAPFFFFFFLKMNNYPTEEWATSIIDCLACAVCIQAITLRPGASFIGMHVT